MGIFYRTITEQTSRALCGHTRKRSRAYALLSTQKRANVQDEDDITTGKTTSAVRPRFIFASKCLPRHALTLPRRIQYRSLFNPPNVRGEHRRSPLSSRETAWPRYETQYFLGINQPVKSSAKLTVLFSLINLLVTNLEQRNSPRIITHLLRRVGDDWTVQYTHRTQGEPKACTAASPTGGNLPGQHPCSHGSRSSVR